MGAVSHRARLPGFAARWIRCAVKTEPISSTALRCPLIALSFALVVTSCSDPVLRAPVETAAQRARGAIEDVPNGWSPDGSQILLTRYFAADRSDLFLVEADGSALYRVTDRPGKDENGSFTPDGLAVSFCSDRAGQDDIYRLPLDGGEPENLTRHPANECEYAWSPAGDRIVFYADRDGDRNLFVVTADGSPAERWTTAPGWDHVTQGAWSPRDDLLVYSSSAGVPYVEGIPGEFDHFALYLLNPGGDIAPPLLLDLPGEDSYPSWSPDGGTVYFAHKAPHGVDDADVGYDIYRVSASGGKAEVFLGGPGNQYLPYWSPDGSRVAYFSEGRVWLADHEGAGRRELTIPDDWSPMFPGPGNADG